MTEISQFQTQKTAKPDIRFTARQQLDGALLKDFETFLDFLMNKKLSLPWTSTNGFNVNYKSKLVGKIYLGGGDLTRNKVEIHVITAKWDEINEYLKMQTDEVVNLFMDCLKNNKCRHCNPDCSCSRYGGPDYKFIVLGKEYEHPCFAFGRHAFKFTNSGKRMSSMVVCSHGSGDNKAVNRMVSMKIVKKLIIARMEFIVSSR